MIASSKFLIRYYYFLLLLPFFGHLYIIIGLPKTITFLFTYATLMFGLYFVIKNFKIIYFPKFLFPLFLYMFYVPIRAHLAELPDRHILTQFYHDILQITIFLLVLIIYNTRVTPRFISNTIIIMKLTIIISAIVSLYQVIEPTFLVNDKFFIGEDLYTIRRPSIFAYEQLGLGLSFIPLFSVFIGYSVFRNGMLPIFYMVLGGVVAMLSNTRFIIVAYIIIGIQVIIFDKKNIKKTYRLWIRVFILVVIVSYILVNLGYNLDDWYNNRLLVEGSIFKTTRYLAITNFMRFFPEFWFFGNGLHNSDEVQLASSLIGSSQIHVGYLAHLVSYGIFGSFLLFTFWILLIKKLYKTARLTKYWGSFFAFVTFFWAEATLVYYSIFFCGLIFAIIFDKYVYEEYLQKAETDLVNNK